MTGTPCRRRAGGAVKSEPGKRETAQKEPGKREPAQNEPGENGDG